MWILKVLNWLLLRIIALLMVLILVFAGYALWSNNRIYEEAKIVYEDLLELKPLISDEDDGEKPDFAALKAINPEVIGWVTLPGTMIDYPILQGPTNLTYMNRNVYGEFSLAGSIFLDTRNSSQFTDHYSLVYGHHMDNRMMLGDLDLYFEYEFFETNRTALVVTEGGILEMTVLAVLEIPDSSREIFDPDMWGRNLTALGLYVQNNATYIWGEAMDMLMENPTTTQAIALATCSGGATGTRRVIILVAHMDDPGSGENTPTKPTTTAPTTPKPPQTGDSILNSPAVWIALLFLAAAGFILLLKSRKE